MLLPSVISVFDCPPRIKYPVTLFVICLYSAVPGNTVMQNVVFNSGSSNCCSFNLKWPCGPKSLNIIITNITSLSFFPPWSVLVLMVPSSEAEKLSTRRLKFVFDVAP